MATRCQECGSTSTGFGLCPICGRDFEDSPVATMPNSFRALTEAEEPVINRQQTVYALVAALVLVLLVVVVMTRLGKHDDPAPARTTSGTPTSSAPVEAGSRRCWDGADVSGSDDCPVPTGLQGLEAVSSTFAAAQREGRCRQDEIPPSQGAYRCDVDGAELVFAWFASADELDSWFQQTYPDCRRVRYLQVCDGTSRQALRYADPRFVVQVTAAATDNEVLLGVPLEPVSQLLRGTEVS